MPMKNNILESLEYTQAYVKLVVYLSGHIEPPSRPFFVWPKSATIKTVAVPTVPLGVDWKHELYPKHVIVLHQMLFCLQFSGGFRKPYKLIKEPGP